MKLTKDAINAMQIEEAIKVDLLALFDEITAKESELAEVKKKTPTDSQTVVEKMDYAKYQADVAELAELKSEMASKIGNEEKGETFLTMFAGFFGDE